ncbi:hypothetical protein GCM10009127_24200 [Alteraurantiacibacter aestuarii]|uniref:hypothetical protein n=1 Tax=Alteraurantiacibacter aestuarii TaxID=650004 RepID=UPI0031DC420B
MPLSISLAMHLPEFILFASDATIVGLWGGLFLLIAVLALAGDWLRARRKDVDRVGCMPWTPIFLACAMIGVGLMVVAVKGWIAG